MDKQCIGKLGRWLQMAATVELFLFARWILDLNENLEIQRNEDKFEGGERVEKINFHLAD